MREYEYYLSGSLLSATGKFLASGGRGALSKPEGDGGKTMALSRGFLIISKLSKGLAQSSVDMIIDWPSQRPSHASRAYGRTSLSWPNGYYV
mmetsp:Transcript_22517/g.32239  ORF Transcript_22517/g.32239 Transcript_22517/m.32239 type:complete len:92 (-) Transcript_22517:184-459(-)